MGDMGLRDVGGIWGDREDTQLGIWGDLGDTGGDTGLGSHLDVDVLVFGVVQEEAKSVFPDGSGCVIDHLGGGGQRG